VSNSGLPSNALSALTFTSLDNATVLVGGAPIAAGTPVPIPGGSASFQFVLRRQTAGCQRRPTPR